MKFLVGLVNLENSLVFTHPPHTPPRIRRRTKGRNICSTLWATSFAYSLIVCDHGCRLASCSFSMSIPMFCVYRIMVIVWRFCSIPAYHPNLRISSGRQRESSEEEGAERFHKYVTLIRLIISRLVLRYGKLQEVTLIIFKQLLKNKFEPIEIWRGR